MSEVKKRDRGSIVEAHNRGLVDGLLPLLDGSGKYDVEQLGPRVQELCGGAVDFSEMEGAIEMIAAVRAAIFEVTDGERGSRQVYRLVDEQNPMGIFDEIRTLIREGNETEIDSGIRRLQAFASLVDAQAFSGSADHVVDEAIRAFMEEELEGWKLSTDVVGLLSGPNSDKKTGSQFLRLLLFARSRGYETIQIERLRLLNDSYVALIAELVQVEELKALSIESWEPISSTDLDCIARIPSLEALSLYSVGLSELPLQLAQMPNLRSLNLRGNPLGEASFELLAQCSALEELDLSFCGLSELPPQLAELSNLRSLALRGDPLGEASFELLAQCSALEELNLSFCDLTELPPRLGELSALESLILIGNRLGDASFEVLGQLDALRVLDMENCGLRALPREIGELMQLEKLHLMRNPIGDADSLRGIGRMTGLRDLNLLQCRLRELPVDFSSLVHLQGLLLGENELRDLPETLFGLDSLKALDVHGNYLPDSLVSRLAAWVQAKDGLRLVTTLIQKPKPKPKPKPTSEAKVVNDAVLQSGLWNVLKQWFQL